MDKENQEMKEVIEKALENPAAPWKTCRSNNNLNFSFFKIQKIIKLKYS